MSAPAESEVSSNQVYLCGVSTKKGRCVNLATDPIHSCMIHAKKDETGTKKPILSNTFEEYRCAAVTQYRTRCEKAVYDSDSSDKDQRHYCVLHQDDRKRFALAPPDPTQTKCKAANASMEQCGNKKDDGKDFCSVHHGLAESDRRYSYVKLFNEWAEKRAACLKSLSTAIDEAQESKAKAKQRAEDKRNGWVGYYTQAGQIFARQQFASSGEDPDYC